MRLQQQQPPARLGNSRRGNARRWNGNKRWRSALVPSSSRDRKMAAITVPDDDDLPIYDPTDVTGRQAGVQGMLPYVLMRLGVPQPKTGDLEGVEPSKNIEYRDMPDFNKEWFYAAIGAEKVPQENRLRMMEGLQRLGRGRLREAMMGRSFTDQDLVDHLTQPTPDTQWHFQTGPFAPSNQIILKQLHDLGIRHLQEQGQQ
jgi:hypothetical protein